MTDIIAWTSGLDHRPFSASASGEDDAWAHWIPRAWHAVADPAGNHPAPERPVRMGGPGHGRVLDEHAELLAWWGPFTHLIMFGLGWTRPGLAIQRWTRMGSPTSDHILSVVSRWWGRDLESFVNWSRSSSTFVDSLNIINVDVGASTEVLSPERVVPVESQFETSVDLRWFGPGSDEMHVVNHLTPMQTPPRGSRDELLKTRTTAGKPPRAVLLLDHYQGWYRQLSSLKLPATEPGKGWRVDVVVEPLGWLGQFRLSHESNRWFRGQHRWHQLGI